MDALDLCMGLVWEGVVDGDEFVVFFFFYLCFYLSFILV